ncbi:phage head spike fiber domain-containing protein [Escherichia coli]
MLSSTLDSRIVYDGPQVYYINRNGNLVQSAANEWPLTFIDGVAVGRVPPDNGVVNFLTQSSNLSETSWSRTRVNVIWASDELSTDYTYSLIPTAVSGSHSVQQIVTGSFMDGSKYTFSWCFKSYGYRFIRLRVYDDIGVLGDSVVDLSDGEVSSGASGTTVTNLGSGWFRVTETITFSSARGSAYLGIMAWVYNSATGSSFIGDGVSGVLSCAPQMERSSFATSPIITNASAVTRYSASAKVVMNGATSINITYSDGSVVNVPSVDGYATIPKADSAWGSKYITTIKFNV